MMRRRRRRAGAAVLPLTSVAVVALFVLRRLPACSCPYLKPYLVSRSDSDDLALWNKVLLEAGERMYAMDPCADNVSFLLSVMRLSLPSLCLLKMEF